MWLVSSVRIAARVTRINDQELPAPDNEAEIRELIERNLVARSLYKELGYHEEGVIPTVFNGIEGVNLDYEIGRASCRERV